MLTAISTQKFKANPWLRAFFVPIFLFVLAAILLLLLLLPKAKHFFNLKGQVETERARLLRLEDKASGLEDISSPGLKDRLELTLRLIPPALEETWILAAVERAAAESNLSLGNFLLIGAQDDVSKKEDRKSGFKIVVFGKTDNFFDFLGKLYVSAPLMNVLSIEATNNGDTLKAELQLGTIFSPLPKEIGSIDSPIALLSPKEEKTLSRISQFMMPNIAEEKLATPSGRANPFINF
ncbi:hypothetical protein FJZ40_03775 [Candidatus Shapirobacteria bacterium]|nr:hypothetical protein [Candidatus Shapirobacteria bacterium]